MRDLPAGLCRGLSHFFTDIDDTLTTDGMLPAASYQALWDLARAGIRVVPVTGRPGGLVRPHRAHVARGRAWWGRTAPSTMPTTARAGR